MGAEFLERPADRADHPSRRLIDTTVEGAGSLELALIDKVVREDLTPVSKPERAVLLHDLNFTGTCREASRSHRTTSPTRSACSTYPTKQSTLSTPAPSAKGTARALLKERVVRVEGVAPRR